MSETFSFNSLPLSRQVARAVSELGYTEATDIQAQAIPYLLEGRDVIGRSSTGTGKTAAFGIPAVECVESENKYPQVLVLSPTRELAMQIALEMRKYSKYKDGVCVATVYGGAPMSEQIRLLKRANIVIGTPGRLMDHLRRKTLKLNDIKMVVLDESDEMLSMGFVEDIQTILTHVPTERQTALFSATMPPAILKIAEEFLTDPQMVDVMTGQETQADIEQTYYYVPRAKKQEALSLLLHHADNRRAIVFCNTKSMVDELAVFLQKQGFKAIGLHGDMTQAVRTNVMKGFRGGNTQILIATDVAARGIDVSDIDTVINFDLPQSFEYYVHRIGRTGRAGKQGVSQTLITDNKEVATLRRLMRFTGNEIAERNLPTGQDMMERAVAKMAEDILPQLQQDVGKAAKMLVKRLKGNEDSDIDPEQIALVLAEKLLGGDSRFKSIEAPKPKKMREAHGDRSSMVTVTADIGRVDRVKPNHFVGAIAELLDIPGSSIGKIEIGENSTRIGLRQDTADELANYKKKIRINGRDVIFTVQRSKRGSKPYTGAPKWAQKPYSTRRRAH